jgi:hypothetical protein
MVGGFSRYNVKTLGLCHIFKRIHDILRFFLKAKAKENSRLVQSCHLVRVHDFQFVIGAFKVTRQIKTLYKILLTKVRVKSAINKEMLG